MYNMVSAGQGKHHGNWIEVKEHALEDPDWDCRALARTDGSSYFAATGRSEDQRPNQD